MGRCTVYVERQGRMCVIDQAEMLRFVIIQKGGMSIGFKIRDVVRGKDLSLPSFLGCQRSHVPRVRDVKAHGRLTLCGIASIKRRICLRSGWNRQRQGDKGCRPRLLRFPLYCLECWEALCESGLSLCESKSEWSHLTWVDGREKASQDRVKSRTR